MSRISEKVAYLDGLMEGLNIQDDKYAKVFTAIVDGSSKTLMSMMIFCTATRTTKRMKRTISMKMISSRLSARTAAKPSISIRTCLTVRTV